MFRYSYPSGVFGLKKSAGTGWYRSITVAILALVYLIVAWQTTERTREAGIASLLDNGRSQLSLFVTYLRGQLEKYEYLPELLSINTRLIELLDGPPDSESVAALNRFLEEVNLISNASDTYLMDRDGMTVAASNWASESPFIGSNFSYRPYFQDAMRGRRGRYFALGSTSKKRGYYFAYPVRREEKILGAVVIKVDMRDVEFHWGGRLEDVIVVDPDGVIFITTRPEWRYRTLSPLAEEVGDRIIESRRYPGTEMTPLPLLSIESREDGSRILKLGSESNGGSERDPRYYLDQVQTMPEAGWKVHLLTPMRPVRQQEAQTLTIATAVFLAILFFGIALRQRQKHRLERARYLELEKQTLQRAHGELEKRVKQRTADLSRSNTRLSEEIEEHRRTEEELRQTQDELVQAAKLATLGQMSAGINHELNQPLAAIRSYADNGRALLERERFDEVRGNLDQISDLTGRMARIGSQLKFFSRRSSGQIGDVSVQEVIEASRAIVAPRVKGARVEVQVDVPAWPLLVRADNVLLQQVLVNLLGNAVQAVEGEKTRLVRIRASADASWVSLVVEDSGPGIAVENRECIFHPFFTTKKASEGLGLGLTISNRIIHDLNGNLHVDHGDLGGARFEIRLPAAVRRCALSTDGHGLTNAAPSKAYDR